jgi:hypothetical protein
MDRRVLLKRFEKHQDEFIKSFDIISQGIRQYDSVYSLISSGDITIDNIEDYGVEASWLIELRKINIPALLSIQRLNHKGIPLRDIASRIGVSEELIRDVIKYNP